jgi:O-antigen/teichoic acid export membrane protein
MLADQGLVSGTSFFSSFLVARTCTKSEFGAYVLAVSIQLALREIQVGLVTGPLAFLGSPRDDKQFASYFTPLILFQAVAAAVISLAAWLIGGVYLRMQVSSTFAVVAAAAAAALFFNQAQEFFRRSLMTRLLFRTAFMNDLVFCFLQVGTLAFIAQFGRNYGLTISPLLVFEVATASGLIASIFGYSQISQFLDGPLRWDIESIRENWDFGRWNLATSLLVAIYQQTVYLMLGSMIGPAAVANIEAPRLLVAPFSVLLQGWNNWMAPSAGKVLAEKGIAGTQSFLNRATAAVVVIIALIILPLMLFPGPVMRKMLGEQYVGDPWIVRMWGASVLCMVVSSGVPCILFLAKLPQKLTLVRLATSVVGLPATFVLILLQGAKGAVASRLVVEAVQAVGAIVATRSFLRSRLKPVPVEQPA